MAMNREQRRYLQKQGQLDDEGNPIAQRPDRTSTIREDRVGPVAYVGEVRSELRRVTWPTRSEVINYTIVVGVTLVVLTGLIALMDWAFGSAIFELLRVGGE